MHDSVMHVKFLPFNAYRDKDKDKSLIISTTRINFETNRGTIDPSPASQISNNIYLNVYIYFICIYIFKYLSIFK